MKFIALLSIILMLFLFVSPPKTSAATTPNLGQTAGFGVLSGTYTNTVGGTTINGDLGYTTGPATVPTINGATHAADGTYNQAGIDQGSALSSLASQPCTFTFGAGAVDLATDTTHGPIGVYTPGVYCTASSSAASIGSGGITLSGSGTYIFRIDGALTTVANSAVTLAGASACDVFWTPTSATTLGANTTFAGTDIDASGITIGSNVTWVGRALAFGGTSSTTTDTISAPTCGSEENNPTPTPTATSSATPSATPNPSSTPGSTDTPSSSSDTSSSSNTTTTSTTPGLPNAGGNAAPRLPDTGIGPDDQNIAWYFPENILKFSFFLLKLILI